MYYNLDIKQSYDFSLLASGVLGLGYKNATVMAIMDYDSAKLINDITTMHSQVYGYLPAGTPRNAEDLTYIKIKTSTGDVRAIAMDWLASAPVLVTSKTVLVKINRIPISNIPLIKDILVQNGFSDIVVTVI